MKNISLISFLALAFVAGCGRATHSAATSSSDQLIHESSVAFNAKDYTKAQALAAQAKALDPNAEGAWVGYGTASAMLGQPDKARDAYERALSLCQAISSRHPSDVSVVYQQIYLLTLLDRSSEAEALLRQARINHPNDKGLTTFDYQEAKREWAIVTVGAN